MSVETSRLDRLNKVINNIEVEFNTGGLNRANKIAKKEAKVYESN